METGKTVQAIKNARGFVTLHDKNGNVIGETVNMQQDTQLHPCERIRNDLISKGLMLSGEKTIGLNQLNLSNHAVVMPNEQNVRHETGIEHLN